MVNESSLRQVQIGSGFQQVFLTSGGSGWRGSLFTDHVGEVSFQSAETFKWLFRVPTNSVKTKKGYTGMPSSQSHNPTPFPSETFDYDHLKTFPTCKTMAVYSASCPPSPRVMSDVREAPSVSQFLLGPASPRLKI